MAGAGGGARPAPSMTSDVTMEPPPVPTMATAVVFVAVGMPGARAGAMPPPTMNDVTMEPPPVPAMATAVAMALVAAGMPRARRPRAMPPPTATLA